MTEQPENEVLTAIAATEARLSSRLNGIADRLEALQTSLARVESKVDFIGAKLLHPSEQRAIGITIGITDPSRSRGGSGLYPFLLSVDPEALGSYAYGADVLLGFSGGQE